MKKRYKILSILLALVLVIGTIVTVSVVSSSAESFKDANGVKWTVTENYPGWAITNIELNGYSGELIIPSEYKGAPVNYIEEYACDKGTSRISITIPDSVTEIGRGAFEKSPLITSVDLGNGVTKIGANAFSGCSGITSVEIPDSVTTIGNGAFNGCTGITSVDLGNGVTTINNSAFSGCTSITSVVIPDSVTTIGDSAFSGCTGITSLDLGNGVQTIGKSALQNCKGITSVEIPDSVTTIGSSAFYGCTGITSVVIPDSVTTIDSSAFYGCTGLTSVDLGNGVATIGSNAFYGCTGITSVEIPDSATTIGKNAFYKCTSLTSVDLGNGVTEIGERAFEYCTGLTSVEIPDSVTTIGPGAFGGCTNLENINIGSNVQQIGSSAFSPTAWYTSQPNGVLYLDNYCLGYKGTAPKGALVIQEGTKTLSDSAFRGCTGITSVVIPDSATSISTAAFYGCTGITSVDLGDGVQGIAKQAFYGCTNLTSAEIPDSVTSIGDSAFFKCSKLTSVEIPDSVTTIDNSAFNGCTSLTSLDLGNGVTKIGANAFFKCTSLTSVEIPDSVTEICSQAFYGCTGLTSVDLGNGVQTIGVNAFSGCTSLTSITIPNSIEFIDYGAFKDCTNLSTVNFPAKAFEYDDSAFSGTAWYNSLEDGLIYNDNILIGYKGTAPTGNIAIKEGTELIVGGALQNCKGITSVEIPDSVTTIGNGAFSGCTGLTSVDLGNGVQTIGVSAFEKCTSLTSVEIPDSVTTIGFTAFGDCTGLTSITIPDSVTTIAYRTFFRCTGITSVEIPDSVTKIAGEAFYGCTKLTSVEIPDSVTTIGEKAFEYCTGLTSITIPDSVTSMNSNAFANCGVIDNFELNTSFENIEVTAFYADVFRNVVIGDSITSIGDEFANMEELEVIVIPQKVTSIKPTALLGSPNVTITTTSNSTAHKFANANNIPVDIIDSVNTIDPVDFEVTCDKTGYEFTVYKVADLETTQNPYEVRYDSLIESVEDEIFNGDSAALLSGLDEVPSSELTEVVGTYSTDEDGASKLFENLEPGIYYVRATDFPANVYWVQNSVFALPYYDATEGWIYEIDPIPLATKVDESDPEIVKTITNSTKDNVNFTDVSLGDTVNFEIEASRVGSANTVESKDFRLNSYVVSDIMENGLTLNQDSFVVTLEDIDGNTIATLDATTDYIIDIVASEGVDTTFTVSLTPEYLQETEFYSSANVVITYSAVLNEYSTREFDGNYNTATNLTYSNKTNVSATVDGNTVYAYTFGIEVNKYDDAGTPLAGSDFALYLTEADAKAMSNAIATGTSTDTGKVEFFTEDEDVIRLQSGTYYIVETKATESYNRYTDVIPVTITVEYGETEANGTYIESAPENGIQLVEVKNSKVLIPNTGGDGALYRYLIAAAFLMLAITFVVLKKRNTTKATAK